MMASIIDQAPATCPACVSPQTGPYTSGTSHRELNLERPFAYSICSNCRLRFQTVTPDVARSLFADVQDTAPRARPRARGELHCEADALRRLRTWTTGNRLLDVGAGDGHFLQAARGAGFDAEGVDVSGRLAETARKRSGAPVHVGDLASLGLAPASFDVVNLDAVLMYVSDPGQLIREVGRLLKPGGICRVHEFDPDSLNGRLKGRRYWLYAPTHVNIWSRRSIDELSARGALAVRRVFPGTEATLRTWLATRPSRQLHQTLVDIARYMLRKARLGSLTLGGDVVYYLQRPAPPLAGGPDAR